VDRKRSSTKALLRRLSVTRKAIYAIDDRRRLVYCNAACAAWLARDAEELVGQRCDFHSQTEGAELASAAAGLCPPAEVFAGKRLKGIVRATLANGALSRRRAEFVPLPAREDGVAGAIVFVDERDLAEGEGLGEGDSPAGALHERLAAFRRRLGARYRLARFAGESPQARRVRAQAQAACECDARVLIHGPEGSGRELLAKAIHYGRRDTPGWLTPLDCRLADAESLQAAVGGFKRKCAESGLEKTSSLLLLNVDELPASGQDELAGFLSLPGFELATIATSDGELAAQAARGEFRRDLALALSTIVIELTPLRDRPEDAPLLAQHHLEEINAAGGRQLSGWSEAALDRLAGYSWPNDAQELASVVQEACLNARGPVVAEGDLPARLRLAAEAAMRPARAAEPIELEKVLAAVERELIDRAMTLAKGNKAKAARLLGISRQRIISRVGDRAPGERAQVEVAETIEAGDD
jgi:transcriptional regulator with PAS, ATPase and Fis domain